MEEKDEKLKERKKLKSAGWVWILVGVALISVLILWLIPSNEKDQDAEAENVSQPIVTDTLSDDNLIVNMDSTGSPVAADSSAVLQAAPQAEAQQPAANPAAAAAAPAATPAQAAAPQAQNTQAQAPQPAAQPQAAPAAAQPVAKTQETPRRDNSDKLRVEPIKYGDFSQWVTRTVTESKPIGGKQKTLYEIAPTASIEGNKPYVNQGGSPWATSNVYAKVAGIVKGSGTVTPANVNGNTMARMEAKMEEVKVLGIINMDVMVAGTIFLGQINEPISSTKGPFSKMEMGIPYTKRPKALVFDYKVDMPAANTRTKATGFGSKQTLQGRDNAEVYVLLQKRWEDEKGKIHALRVGTGRERYNKSIPLTLGHQLPIYYGDITKQPFFKPYMGLLNGDKAYYAKNSKGKLVPVQEEGWASPDETPTHVLVMCSSSCGEPFVGTEGLTLYIDNVGFGF